jgi:hypothetical protein
MRRPTRPGGASTEGVIVTLRREEVVPGTLTEFEAFETLVRALDAPSSAPRPGIYR